LPTHFGAGGDAAHRSVVKAALGEGGERRLQDQVAGIRQD
jgi:hypothetical protein